jgi:glycosylphosphatidylinositol phospholipase D
VTGDETASFVGTSLDAAGDTDGDGRSALLVGGLVPTGEDAWSAAGWLLDVEAGVSHPSSAATVALLGGVVPAHAPAALPMVVRAVGDVDGDGDVDVAIVWQAASGPVGAVWTSPWDQAEVDLAGADATLSGLVSFSGVRSPIAPLGDLDGDGYGDLAVGSWGSSAAAAQGGAVHVLMGGPGL